MVKPAPRFLDGSRDSQSPVSLRSRQSTDLLMRPSTPPVALQSFSEAEALSTVQRRTADPTASPGQARVADSPESKSASQSRPSGLGNGGLKRSSAYRDRRSMTPYDGDEDARILTSSINAGNALHQKSASLSPKRLVDPEARKRDVQTDSVAETSPFLPSRAKSIHIGLARIRVRHQDRPSSKISS